MIKSVFICDESVLMCVNRMKNTMQTIEQSKLKKKMNANARRGHQSIKKNILFNACYSEFNCISRACTIFEGQKTDTNS